MTRSDCKSFLAVGRWHIFANLHGSLSLLRQEEQDLGGLEWQVGQGCPYPVVTGLINTGRPPLCLKSSSEINVRLRLNWGSCFGFVLNIKNAVVSFVLILFWCLTYTFGLVLDLWREIFDLWFCFERKKVVLKPCLILTNLEDHRIQLLFWE